MEVTSIDLTAKELGFLVKALDVVTTANLLTDDEDGHRLILRFADALAFMEDMYLGSALAPQRWI